MTVTEESKSTFDIVREGARKDGVEIVHYEPQYAVPGTKAERRMVRIVALLFVLSGLFALGGVAAYIWWPWEYEPGFSQMKGFTPLVGLGLAGAFGFLGLGILTWGKKLLPHEIAIQDRHDGPSDPQERKYTGETLKFIGSEMGLNRRPLLKAALLAPAAGIGVLAAAIPVGMLIRDPHGHGDPLFHTGFDKDQFNGGKPVRLVREDMTAIRPEDVSVGGQMTVYPGIPGGASNEHADSPTLLIHLRQEDADEMRANINEINKDSNWQNFVAYSKICTHAGCPASLYEQQTNRLLCPCHQSQFHITDNARPIFGPASRSLPMLPIGLDDEGYFVATSDYKMAVGPAFWERP